MTYTTEWSASEGVSFFMLVDIPIKVADLYSLVHASLLPCMGWLGGGGLKIYANSHLHRGVQFRGRSVDGSTEVG